MGCADRCSLQQSIQKPLHFRQQIAHGIQAFGHVQPGLPQVPDFVQRDRLQALQCPGNGDGQRGAFPGCGQRGQNGRCIGIFLLAQQAGTDHVQGFLQAFGREAGMKEHLLHHLLHGCRIGRIPDQIGADPLEHHFQCYLCTVAGEATADMHGVGPAQGLGERLPVRPGFCCGADHPHQDIPPGDRPAVQRHQGPQRDRVVGKTRSLYQLHLSSFLDHWFVSRHTACHSGIPAPQAGKRKR